MTKTFLTFAAGAAALAAATSANAATFNIQSVSTAYNGPNARVELGNKDYSGSLSPQNISGIWNGELVNFLAYCLELTQTAGTGKFEVVPLSSYLSGSRGDDVAALVSNYAGSNNQTKEAALQLALWEVRYEKSNNSLNVNNGHLDLEHVSGVNQNTLTNTANSYLANMGDVDGNLEFWVATNDKKQDLLFYTVKPPVPEPATWAMMIIGFASIGRAMRARRMTSAVSFS